jgi:hypothetical protein
MKKYFLLYIFLLAPAFFFTCSNDVQSPFSRDKARVFLILQSSDKATSDSAITDTVGDTVRIGVVFFMSWYFDSVLVTAGKSITTIDTFFVCKKADIKGDTVWYSCSFASVGERSVNVTGYVKGGYRPTASGTISILEKPIPKTPHAISQTVSLKEDSSTVITLSAVDPEGKQIAAWQIIDTVKHGVLIGSANNYTYTPRQYYHGPDTLTFRASDGIKWSDTGIISINVVHANHPPAWKQSTMNLSIKEGKTLDFDLSTVFDKDPDGDSVKFYWKSGVGSIKIDGKNWTWSPDFTAAAGSPAASVVTAKDNGMPNMSADIALSISVTDSTCKLTLTAALGQGTFSTTPTGTAFDPGTEVQITAKPAADYIFKNWLGDIGNADSSKDSITISMNNQKNISAIFVKAIETVTLNNDEWLVHGSLYLNGYYYLSTRTSPAKIIRLNANNLADYKVITFPDGYSSAEQLAYSSNTGKIYTIFFSGDNKTEIASIDPSTMAYNENAIYDSLHDSQQGSGPTIAIDGDYLYSTAFVHISGHPIERTLLLKYSLTSMSSIPVDSLLLDSTCSNAHSMRYKDGMLYITGATTPPWIAKVRASDMTLIQKKDMPGGDIFTDDFAMTDSYIFGGLESDYHSSYSGTIFRISQNDITQIYGIATGTKGGSGLAGNCYGVQEAIGYIWAIFNTTPGTLTRIDPVSLQFKNYRLDYNSPNEIISDGKRLFITYWNLTPGVVQAFDPSYLNGREIP